MAPYSVTLTYFNHRARAEALRWVLAQAGVKYTDKRIKGEEWKDLKPKTPTGTLPFLCVDGTEIGQTSAIFQYLASEYKLNGCNKVEAALVQMLFCQLDEFMNAVYGSRPKDESKKAEASKKMEDEGCKLMKILKCRLSGGKQWLVGDKLTAADLAVACRLCDIKERIGELLKDAPEVEALMERVSELPNIKKWVEIRPVT